MKRNVIVKIIVLGFGFLILLDAVRNGFNTSVNKTTNYNIEKNKSQNTEIQIPVYAGMSFDLSPHNGKFFVKYESTSEKAFDSSKNLELSEFYIKDGGNYSKYGPNAPRQYFHIECKAICIGDSIFYPRVKYRVLIREKGEERTQVIESGIMYPINSINTLYRGDVIGLTADSHDCGYDFDWENLEIVLELNK